MTISGLTKRKGRNNIGIAFGEQNREREKKTEKKHHALRDFDI